MSSLGEHCSEHFECSNAAMPQFHGFPNQGSEVHEPPSQKHFPTSRGSILEGSLHANEQDRSANCWNLNAHKKTMQSTTKRQDSQHSKPEPSSSRSSTSAAMDQFLDELAKDVSEKWETPIRSVVIENDNAFMIPSSMSQSFSHLELEDCALDKSYREERWESPEHILRNDGTALAQPKVISKQRRLPPVPKRQESIEMTEAILSLKWQSTSTLDGQAAIGKLQLQRCVQKKEHVQQLNLVE